MATPKLGTKKDSIGQHGGGGGVRKQIEERKLRSKGHTQLVLCVPEQSQWEVWEKKPWEHSHAFFLESRVVINRRMQRGLDGNSMNAGVLEEKRDFSS